MPFRRKAQLLFKSRAGLRQPSLLVNSIPKSGTHLIKAVLEGGGYRFAGHYGDSELSMLEMQEGGGRYFATAHLTRSVIGPGQRLFVYRDPADVALSMAIYIRARKDHPRHKIFSPMRLEQAVEAIFRGTADLEPLALRYVQMWDWAQQSKAILVDFAEVRQDPTVVLERIGSRDFKKAAVITKIEGWNPTKRTKKDPQENGIKSDLRGSNSDSVRQAFNVYQEIKSSS